MSFPENVRKNSGKMLDWAGRGRYGGPIMATTPKTADAGDKPDRVYVEVTERRGKERRRVGHRALQFTPDGETVLERIDLLEAEHRRAAD